MKNNNVISEILKVSGRWINEKNIKDGWEKFIKESNSRMLLKSIPTTRDKESTWNLFYKIMLESVEQLPQNIEEEVSKNEIAKEISKNREESIKSLKKHLNIIKEDVINHVFPILEDINKLENSIDEYSKKLKDAYENANYDFMVKISEGNSEFAATKQINLIKHYNGLYKIDPNFVSSVVGDFSNSEETETPDKPDINKYHQFTPSILRNINSIDDKAYKNVENSIKALEKSLSWKFDPEQLKQFEIANKNGLDSNGNSAIGILKKEFIKLIQNSVGVSWKEAYKIFNELTTGSVGEIYNLKDFIKIFPENSRNILYLFGAKTFEQINEENLKNNPYTLNSDGRNIFVNHIKIINDLNLDKSRIKRGGSISSGEGKTHKLEPLGASKLVKSMRGLDNQQQSRAQSILTNVSEILDEYIKIKKDAYVGVSLSKSLPEPNRKRMGVGINKPINKTLLEIMEKLGLNEVEHNGKYYTVSVSEFKRSLIGDSSQQMSNMVKELFEELASIKNEIIQPGADSISAQFDEENKTQIKEILINSSMPRQYSHYYNNTDKDPIKVAYLKMKQQSKPNGTSVIGNASGVLKKYNTEDEVMNDNLLSDKDKEKLLLKFGDGVVVRMKTEKFNSKEDILNADLSGSKKAELIDQLNEKYITNGSQYTYYFEEEIINDHGLRQEQKEDLLKQLKKNGIATYDAILRKYKSVEEINSDEDLEEEHKKELIDLLNEIKESDLAYGRGSKQEIVYSKIPAEKFYDEKDIDDYINKTGGTDDDRNKLIEKLKSAKNVIVGDLVKKYQSEEDIINDQNITGRQKKEALETLKSKPEQKEENDFEAIIKSYLGSTKKSDKNITSYFLNAISELSKKYGNASPLSNAVSDYIESNGDVPMENIVNIIKTLNKDIDESSIFKLTQIIISNQDYEALDLLAGIKSISKPQKSAKGLIGAATSIDDKNIIQSIMDIINNMQNPLHIDLRNIMASNQPLANTQKEYDIANIYNINKITEEPNVAMKKALFSYIKENNDLPRKRIKDIKNYFEENKNIIINNYGIDAYDNILGEHPNLNEDKIIDLVISRSKIDLVSSNNKTESIYLLNNKDREKLKNTKSKIREYYNIESLIRYYRHKLDNLTNEKEKKSVSKEISSLIAKQKFIGNKKSAFDVLQKYEEFMWMPPEYDPGTASNNKFILNNLQMKISKLVKELVANTINKTGKTLDAAIKETRSKINKNSYFTMDLANNLITKSNIGSISTVDKRTARDSTEEIILSLENAHKAYIKIMEKEKDKYIDPRKRIEYNEEKLVEKLEKIENNLHNIRELKNSVDNVEKTTLRKFKIIVDKNISIINQQKNKKFEINLEYLGEEELKRSFDIYMHLMPEMPGGNLSKISFGGVYYLTPEEVEYVIDGFNETSTPPREPQYGYFEKFGPIIGRAMSMMKENNKDINMNNITFIYVTMKDELHKAKENAVKEKYGRAEKTYHDAGKKYDEESSELQHGEYGMSKTSKTEYESEISDLIKQKPKYEGLIKSMSESNDELINIVYEINRIEDFISNKTKEQQKDILFKINKPGANIDEILKD